MTPDGCGRFCATCQKTVIDFTVMTDADILDIFRNSETIPCGRFFPEQLDRPLQASEIKKSFPFYRKIAAAILALQAVTIASFAQTRKKPAVAYHKKITPAPGQQTIKGRLLDSETGRPVAHLPLTVTAAGIDSVRVTTDNAGYFRFTLPDSVLQISFSADDIQTKYIVNDVVGLPVKNNLVLYSYPKHILPVATVTTPEIFRYETGRTMGVIVPELTIERFIYKRTFWYRITHPFRKKHR